MDPKPRASVSARVLESNDKQSDWSQIGLCMFGRIKANVISHLRDLKNEWIHLDKAMQYWMHFTAIVITGFLIIVTIHIINNYKDKEALYLKHEYCYAYVFKDYYSGKGNYRIRIRYNVEGSCFEKGLFPKAHVGDSILIMYNPNKPASCLPVEYNKKLYVTKQMVDFHMYQINPDSIH